MRDFAERIIKEAGKMAAKGFRSDMEQTTKRHRNDILTEYDTAINAYLVSEIQSTYPEHGIISEEMDAMGEDKEYVWTIDPIDGTKNFATGVPFYCILIGLLHNSDPVLGLTYAPETNELFIAEKGKGLTLNGEHVTSSEHSTLQDSYGISDAGYREDRIALRRAFTRLGDTHRFGVNAFSCTGLALASVAAGRRDWMARIGGSVWDYAPGVIQLREAGCIVSKLNGEPWDVSEKGIIGANPVLHAELVEKFNL